ncbi:MAG: hypothetical protein QOE84_3759 [Actinomycetota bacterium]|jgi:hypothetical protein|nr:hypothetical protein [Actinomycetota bacterium]
MDATTARTPDDGPSLGAELRESLLLLSISVGVTAAVTLAAQATLSLLG